jgi:hypothetical protein
VHTGQIVGGRYRLEEPLGSGGHGEVWRAADLNVHERPVAVKRTRYDSDAEGADRVRREARYLARINHPHVVAVHDVVDDGGDAWVVMEYVAGLPLSRSGRVPVERAARYGAQLAGGLEAVHAHRILHRDIKPANVLVTDDGFAKIADFGISRPVHDDETVTATGALTGTPGYLAPEVAKGGRFTEAADVWSLGATLYYLLEGTTPFGDDNPHALLWKTVSEEVRPPTRAGSMAPVVLRMLARKPTDRPRLKQVRQELAALAGDPAAGVGPEPSRRIGPLVTLGRPGRALTTAGVAAVLVVALSLIAWSALDRGRAQGDELPGAGASADGDDSTTRSTDGDKVGIIGDPATADPCALLDAEALGAFGLTRLDTDDGELNRCDVFVTHDDGAGVEVSLKIWQNSEEPTEPNRQVGKVTVVNDESELPDECSRELFLPGGDYNLSLDAELETGEVADLCALADATLNHATGALNDGQLPRREHTPDPSSLYTQSACDLLAGEPLERLPGVDANHPLVGFAEWDCTWHAEDGKELRALFQHHEPFTADDGERFLFSGHETVDEGDSWSSTSCLVSIVNREAPSVHGDGTTVAELVRLELSAGGDEPVDELCDLLVDIAEPVAAALPAVS